MTIDDIDKITEAVKREVERLEPTLRQRYYVSTWLVHAVLDAAKSTNRNQVRSLR